MSIRQDLVWKEPVETEADLASFDPKDLGVNAFGALCLAAFVLWVFNPASVKTPATGVCVVPKKIEDSDAYQDDPTTAPGRWELAGGTSSGNPAGSFTLQQIRATDALAADEDEQTLFVVQVPTTLTSVKVYPDATLAGDNTNTATIVIKCHPPEGDAFTMVSKTVNVASGGLVQWTAFELTNTADIDVPAGSVITVEKVAVGTGAVLPRMNIVAVFET